MCTRGKNVENKMDTTLYVKGFPCEMNLSKEYLFKIFSEKFGSVENVNIFYPTRTEPYALIQFTNKDVVKKASRQCNLSIIYNQIYCNLLMHQYKINDSQLNDDSEMGGSFSTKSVLLGPELCEFLGQEPNTRLTKPEVLNKVYACIEKNETGDSDDDSEDRNFILDAKLEKLFGDSKFRKKPMSEYIQRNESGVEVTDTVNSRNLHVHLQRHFKEQKKQERQKKKKEIKEIICKIQKQLRHRERYREKSEGEKSECTPSCSRSSFSKSTISRTSFDSY